MRHSVNSNRKFSNQEQNILLIFIFEKYMCKTYENSQLLENIIATKSKHILQLLDMNAVNDKLEYFNTDCNP